MPAGLEKQPWTRRCSQKRYSKPMAEINVTPFVDVMLVLLIVFMVAAPMLTVGVPVELPKTVANALPTDKEEPLTVTITALGTVLLQKTETPVDQLVNKLQAIKITKNLMIVLIILLGLLTHFISEQQMDILTSLP